MKKIIALIILLLGLRFVRYCLEPDVRIEMRSPKG